MSRIAATFAKLEAAQAQGARFRSSPPATRIPRATVPLMHALVEAGADIIELGVPFSDPMADGPTIQRSSERALKHGTSLAIVLDAGRAISRRPIPRRRWC